MDKPALKEIVRETAICAFIMFGFFFFLWLSKHLNWRGCKMCQCMIGNGEIIQKAFGDHECSQV